MTKTDPRGPKPWFLPPRGQELILARALQSGERSLDYAIVDSLVGQPQRYTDLKPLLDGRNDKGLDRALDRLRHDGVIQQGYDVSRKESRYALTIIGKLVWSKVQQNLAFDSIVAYQQNQPRAAAP